MNGVEVQARVDGMGYMVMLPDRTKIDILIDPTAIAQLALKAVRNRSGRSVSGPCKATVRRPKGEA